MVEVVHDYYYYRDDMDEHQEMLMIMN